MSKSKYRNLGLLPDGPSEGLDEQADEFERKSDQPRRPVLLFSGDYYPAPSRQIPKEEVKSDVRPSSILPLANETEHDFSITESKRSLQNSDQKIVSPIVKELEINVNNRMFSFFDDLNKQRGTLSDLEIKTQFETKWLQLEQEYQDKVKEHKKLGF